MKPKLKLHVGQATHFLRWELPYFRKHFEIVDEAGADVVLLVYGPDILKSSAEISALRRVAMLFPGWGFNPYHNHTCRNEALDVIESCYDLVMVNPGPLSEALKSSRKVACVPFSVDTILCRCIQPRKSIDSLVHVSADYPQKDWQRSAKIMELTGLRQEVYPPRGYDQTALARVRRRVFDSPKKKLNKLFNLLGRGEPFRVMPSGYVHHAEVVKKYQEYDGFVHVAAEYHSPIYLDGKYTACLLEAGANGAVLFWHDTYGLGNDFETIFHLPLDVVAAADSILRIRSSIDVEKHSRLTSEEILDRCSPERVVAAKCHGVRQLL